MLNRIFTILPIGIMLSVLSATSHAMPIYNFEFDVADWGVNSTNSTDSFQTGDSVTITFENNTDLNNIASTDIFSYQYNVAAGTTGVNYRGSGWRNDVGNIGNAFSYDGANLSLTYDNFGGDFIQATDDQGLYSQIVSGQGWHAYTQILEGGRIYLDRPVGGSVTIAGQSANAVPEPAPALLLGIGAAAFMFTPRRRRNFLPFLVKFKSKYTKLAAA